MERLIEYKKYKDVTESWKTGRGLPKRLFREPFPLGDYDAHDPFVLDVDVADLCNAFAQAMRRYINLYNDDYNQERAWRRRGYRLPTGLNI